jgi:hypothetical protein
MTWKSFFASSFFFFFFAFMAVHFATMKTPAQDRYVAGEAQVIKPWYDASFKI